MSIVLPDAPFEALEQTLREVSVVLGESAETARRLQAYNLASHLKKRAALLVPDYERRALAACVAADLFRQLAPIEPAARRALSALRVPA